MSPSTLRLSPSPRTLIGATLALGVLALVLHVFLGSSSVRTAYVQPVTLMPPAPPAPPPPEAKRVEQEEPPEHLSPTDLQDEGIRESGPVANATSPATGAGAGLGLPATGPLGFNEAGEAGSDVFGLAARHGGHELLSTAPGGGGGGDRNARFIQYADTLKSYLQVQLNEVEELRRACYSVQVTVRVGGAGQLQDVKIRKSTGDPALDAQLRSVLSSLPPMDHLPPPDMPWPVGLRIVSRRDDCSGAAGSN